MGLGQLRGSSWWTGTPRNYPNQISIIPHGGLEVCDGGHGWLVMKKVRRQIAEVETHAASHVSKTARRGAPTVFTLPRLTAGVLSYRPDVGRCQQSQTASNDSALDLVRLPRDPSLIAIRYQVWDRCARSIFLSPIPVFRP
jgi:hypothetical protein